MNSEEWKFLLNFRKNQEEEETIEDKTNIPEGAENIGIIIVIKTLKPLVYNVKQVTLFSLSIIVFKYHQHWLSKRQRNRRST